MTSLAIRTDIASVPTDELKRRLVDGLRMTAERLLNLGETVVELERRGEDLSALRMGMVTHLRAIGAGTLLPEIVVRYSGKQALLDRIAGLPLSQQQALIESPSVPILVNGEVQRIDPLAIPYRSIDQVFSGASIRNESDQRAYLASKPRNENRPRDKARQLKAHADHDLGGIRVGKAFVPRAEIVMVLAELAGPLEEEHPDDWETATVKLTKAEKARLKGLEREAGLSEWKLIRQALRACGLI